KMRASTARRSIIRIGLTMVPGLVLWALALTLTVSQALAAEPSDTPALEKYTPTAEQLREAYQRTQRSGQSGARVYKTRIAPNWFQNNTRFWYRNDLRGGAKEFIVVEAEQGTRRAAFDHAKLAAALAKAASKPYQADRLPFDSIEFVDNAKAI